MIASFFAMWEAFGAEFLADQSLGLPLSLAQSGVPVVLPSSGTITSGGAITLLTALPATYSGGAWIYLPAGAVVGGSAGLYYCLFSSATVGAVKTNYVAAGSTAFTPYIPDGALVAAVGSGSAYTQTTGSDCALANIVVEAASMGANGSIIARAIQAIPNSIGTKTMKLKFGGSEVMLLPLALFASVPWVRTITNRGSVASQITEPLASTTQGAYLTANVALAIDTSVAQRLLFTAQLATATDFVVLESMSCSLSARA